jgi:hypothetical protein
MKRWAAVLCLVAGCKSADAGPCEWTPGAEDLYEWRLDLVDGDCETLFYSSNFWGSDTVVPGWCEPIDVRGCYAEFACSAGEAYGGSTQYVARITMDSATGGVAEVTADGCTGEYELSVRQLDDFGP